MIKIKDFFNKWGYYLLGIFLSLLLFMTILAVKKITPFGDNSFLTIDFYHQYGPMLGGMHRRIFSFGSLIYSFNSGLGLPIYRNFMNYLSSPINMLILLFKYRGLLTSFTFIIGLKAILSCVTILYYFKEKFDKDYKFITLAVLYAFSAYYVAYYWNIMWLDGMYMLPLIALGIEKLIDKNKPLLYILSLASMLLINYFIGYMLCIFSVLYFILCMIIKTDKFDKKNILKKSSKFFISSLIAGGLVAVMLIPLFFSLKGISAIGDVWPSSQYYGFTFKEFLFGHFSAVGSTVLKSGITCSPNISCGVMMLLLLLVFILNKKISLKIKIGYIVFLLVLILSFIIAPIDFIWHGLHVPNDLPFRYSFIYSFILAVIGAYAIKNIKGIKLWYLLLIYIFLLVLTILMKILKYENITDNMIILNGIILLIYSGMMFLHLKKPKWNRYLLIVVLLTVGVEIVFNLNTNWHEFASISNFYSQYDDTNTVLDYVDSVEDDKFYRVEFTDLLSFSNAIWYGYYGLNTFSSMQYYDMAKFMNRMGIAGNEINSYYYKKNTPIFDMMFDLKYILGDVSSNEYIYLDNIGNTDVYRNKYTLGLMYGVDKDILSWFISYNPFLNQDQFMEKATGITDILEPVDDISVDTIYDEDNKKIIKISFPNDYNNYYVYDNYQETDFMVIGETLYHIDEGYNYVNMLNEIAYYREHNYTEEHIINNIDYNEPYITIYAGGFAVDENTLSIYRINEDKFLAAYGLLKNNKVEITDFKESKIVGTYNFDSDKVIYTSIPYDKGWRVYIDNKRVDTVKIGDALLGFKAPNGEHTVKLKYQIPYFKIGLFISIISVISLVIFNRKNKKIKKV